MPSKHIKLVNGKVIKYKKASPEPDNEMIPDASVTNIETKMVNQRKPEVTLAGEGFNMKTFTSPINHMKTNTTNSINKVNNKVNNDIVSGLGLLSFGSSLRNTKSKNIKLII